MLSGEFERKLRKVSNGKLRVFCGDTDHLPAGIFRIVDGEWETECAIDKQWVPEHTSFKDDGQINKAGWRRALRVLIQKGLVDRRLAERVFMTHLPYVSRTKAKPVFKQPKSVREIAEKHGVYRGECNV